jgi:hypothetical protein
MLERIAPTLPGACPSFWKFRPEHGGDLAAKNGYVMHGGSPHFVPINAEIVVNDNIS